jgi:hypothetical protein
VDQLIGGRGGVDQLIGGRGGVDQLIDGRGGSSSTDIKARVAP